MTYFGLLLISNRWRRGDSDCICGWGTVDFVQDKEVRAWRIGVGRRGSAVRYRQQLASKFLSHLPLELVWPQVRVVEMCSGQIHSFTNRWQRAGGALVYAWTTTKYSRLRNPVFLESRLDRQVCISTVNTWSMLLEFILV